MFKHTLVTRWIHENRVLHRNWSRVLDALHDHHPSNIKIEDQACHHQTIALADIVEEETCAPGQNDPKESETDRSVRLTATHAPVFRAKADGRWEKSTPHVAISLSLYSKSEDIALLVSDVEGVQAKRDGSVTQMRWSLDVVYAVWLSDEVNQQPGNVCFNIILADCPTVKTRTFTGTKQWQIVHNAPPSKLCSMSTTHAYLRCEIKQTLAEAFVKELRQHYFKGRVENNSHVIRFTSPSSRSGNLVRKHLHHMCLSNHNHTYLNHRVEEVQRPTSITNPCKTL